MEVSKCVCGGRRVCAKSRFAVKVTHCRLSKIERLPPRHKARLIRQAQAELESTRSTVVLCCRLEVLQLCLSCLMFVTLYLSHTSHALRSILMYSILLPPLFSYCPIVHLVVMALLKSTFDFTLCIHPALDNI